MALRPVGDVRPDGPEWVLPQVGDEY